MVDHSTHNPKIKGLNLSTGKYSYKASSLQFSLFSPSDLPVRSTRSHQASRRRNPEDRQEVCRQAFQRGHRAVVRPHRGLVNSLPCQIVLAGQPIITFLKCSRTGE